MVKSACKNKGMAISIIEIITDAMSPGTQKDALLSVAKWIESGDGLELKVITEAEAKALET